MPISGYIPARLLPLPHAATPFSDIHHSALGRDDDLLAATSTHWRLKSKLSGYSLSLVFIARATVLVYFLSSRATQNIAANMRRR